MELQTDNPNTNCSLDLLHHRHRYTVKHLLFAMTLFSRTFARQKRHENKVPANNLSYKDYRTKEGNSRK